MESARFSQRVKSKCRSVCSVKGCKSRLNKDLDVVFHGFPPAGKRFVTITNGLGNLEKIDQSKAWKRVLKINEVNQGKRVCSLHFKKDDYLLPNVAAKHRILKKNAVPSINLPNVIKVDINRETRLINQRKRKEKMMARQKEVEDDIPGELDQNSPRGENKWNVQVEKTPSMPSTRNVEVQVARDFPKFVDLITTDAELRILTGIESLQILETIVKIVSDTIGNKFKHSNIKMSIYDRVIMTYIKLKQNLSFSCLAVLFQCYSSNDIQRVFDEMKQILSECSKRVEKWPSKKMVSRNLP